MHVWTIGATLLVFGLSTLPASSSTPLPGSFGELADLRSVCRARSWRTGQASGYDRGGGFYDSGNFLRVEPGRRYVLMEAQGPACIDRIWTTRKTDREPYDILLYIDDEKTPVVREDLDRLFTGEREPFVAPFAGSVARARYSYVPIGYRSFCRVVLVPTAPDDEYQWRTNSEGRRIPHVYYQITYRTFPAAVRVRPFRRDLESAEREALERARSIWRRAGDSPWGDVQGLEENHVRASCPPGERAVLFDVQGPAVIYRLGIRLLTPGPPRGRLEIHWDDGPKPAVTAPLGAFFASPGGAEVKGLWLGRRGDEFYCHLPMPFRRRAVISLRGEGEEAIEAEARIRVRRETPGPEDLLLHARYYDHPSPPAGRDYLVLETAGRGHFIGVVMDRPGNMEGDDRFFVDGETEPSVHGTGTEDFFNFAWGFSHLASLPLHGITEQAGARVCYRFHLPASVPFDRSLRVSWEHGSGNEHRGRYSGVAFWYLAPGAASDRKATSRSGQVPR